MLQQNLVCLPLYSTGGSESEAQRENLSLKVVCSWTEVCKEIGNRVKHLINLDQLVDMKLIPKLSNMAHKPSADIILKEKVGGKYEKTMFVLEVF